VFKNFGVVKKTVGGGQTTFNVTFTNVGTIQILSGTISFPSFATNHGVIDAGPSGTLNITTAFANASDGTLKVQILDAAQFGHINVSGNIDLDGKLLFERIGGFVPVLGASFSFLTSASRTGAFAILEGASLGNGTRLALDTALPTTLKAVVVI